MYELSEARYAGTSLIHDGTRPGSVGRPRGRTELTITDEAGEPVPTGDVGEIRLRWRGLPPQHYFRDADATARVFVDGWTRTGDAGRLDEDGYLHLSDRIKDVIIKGGMNIGSLEVENVLIEHPDITECAVFGVPDEVNGEEVAAAVVSTRDISLGELQMFLRAKLPVSKLPWHLLRVPELPRNGSAKVMKGELRRMLSLPTPSPELGTSA
jgi:acyl-CoA synthetase (AMP-forming)/AMP-acid ligase II